MRLINDQIHLDFMGKRKLAMGLSALLIVAGVLAFFFRGGLNYGIDFSGGTLVQVQLEKAVDINAIRDLLAGSGVPSFSLQVFGEDGANEYLITLAREDTATNTTDHGVAASVQEVLTAGGISHSVRRVESVGPKVGEELKESAFLAIALSMVLILLYVWLRFEWRYSVGAILALAHDVLIVVAAFVVTEKEISLPVVAAILTVAGYSINDTIVIFDRLRENLRKYKKRDLADVINEAINQTLSRTLLTSGTTLFVVGSIFVFGGEIINDFAFALLLGITVGTYSSVFIAAPMVYMLLGWYPPKLR